MYEVDVYARISDDQADDAHGTDNQIAECKAHAAAQGWSVVEVYRDDSISATKGKTRPGFESLLERPLKRPVLVWHTDRLVRVSADLERVLDQGLTVHALQAGLIDLSTSTGRAVARTVTAWATHEGELKAQRQVSANAALAAAGSPLWRVAPYGHAVDGSLVPHEAQTLQEAAERVLSGQSVQEVRRWLATVPGAPTTNLNRLLRNPRLAGHNVYKGERMPASNIVPILDEDTYSELVGLLSDPQRRSGTKNGKVSSLLTSVALCGICNDGSTVHAASGRAYPIYRCKSGNHNAHPRWPADSLVSQAVLDLLTGPDAPEVIERHSNTPQSVKDELRTARAELTEWEAVASQIGPAEYLRVTKDVRSRIAALEETARSTSHRALFEGLGVRPDMTLREWHTVRKEASARWHALPLLKQREIVSTLFTVTLLPREKPKGPASRVWQEEAVRIEPR